MNKYEKKFDEAPMKKLVWLEITKVFNKQNNKLFDHIKIENKWKSLKRTYKNIKKHNASSGNDRKVWKYFDEMNNMLYNKPEIEAPATCSNESGLIIREDVQNEVPVNNINGKT